MDGLLLLVGLAAFVVYVVRKSASERQDIKRTYEHEYGQATRGGQEVRGVLFLLLGVGMLWLGSTWLVDATINIGRGIGVTDLVMGLTILGIGTSTPETATAISAILRGERELGIEHIISSSIFNILGGLSLAALWTTGGLEIPTSAFRLDLPVLTAAAAGCLPVFVLGRLLPRWGGALSITLYIVYVTYLVMNATRHGEEGVPGTTIGFVLIGLAIGEFAVVLVRSFVVRGKGPAEQATDLSDETD
jgi:cation:H+ antiporter